jgi:protein-glutamine gamma-glutamyltransferase
MRFGIVHRIFLDSLATLGIVALMSTGELNRPTLFGLLIALTFAILAPGSIRDSKFVQVIGGLLPVCFLFVQLYRLSTSASVVTLAVEFAALLQVIRLATRRGAAHDQQIILLALLHLVAATVLGAGLAYAACFVGFMFLAPVTLLLSHLRREVEGNYRQGAKDRAGLPVDVPRILRSRRVVGPAYLAFVISLSAPMFVFTGLLFATFPRVGLSLLLLQPPRKTRMVGFSDHIDLGVVGRLQTDPSIALRLTYADMPKTPPERLAVYLRGATLDRYDGQAWTKNHSLLRQAEHERTVYPVRRWPNRGIDRSVTVELNPIDPPIVFLPADATALQILPQMRGEGEDTVALFRSTEDEFQYAAEPSSGLRYRVFFASNEAPCVSALPSAERSKYLTLPSTISSRVGKLARDWAGGETNPSAQAQLIERNLKQQYRYDLDSPSGAAKNPIEDFLFASKRGHCEYYATAMAVMLRTLGIPSRDVTGFAAATYNRFGHFYVVRQSDAHSWVEAWFDHVGWQRFDPTPSQANAAKSEYATAIGVVRDLIEAAAQRWSRHVEAYDMQQQMLLVNNLRSHVRRLGGASKIDPWFIARSTLAFLLSALAVFRLWQLWKRRRRTQLMQFREQTKLSPPAKAAIRLYQALELVMSDFGIGRPLGTPPTAWALTLLAQRHPIAERVVTMTQTYVEARFGSRNLSESDIQEFEQGIQLLRQVRPRKRAA